MDSRFCTGELEHLRDGYRITRDCAVDLWGRPERESSLGPGWPAYCLQFKSQREVSHLHDARRRQRIDTADEPGKQHNARLEQVSLGCASLREVLIAQEA